MALPADEKKRKPANSFFALAAILQPAVLEISAEITGQLQTATTIINISYVPQILCGLIEQEKQSDLPLYLFLLVLLKFHFYLI